MLTVPKKYELELELPLDVIVDDSSAKFVKDHKRLVIVAPLNNSKSWLMMTASGNDEE